MYTNKQKYRSRDVLDCVAAVLQRLEKLSLWCVVRYTYISNPNFSCSTVNYSKIYTQFDTQHSDMSPREVDAEVQSFKRAVAAIVQEKEADAQQQNAIGLRGGREGDGNGGGVGAAAIEVQEESIARPAQAGGGGGGGDNDGDNSKEKYTRPLCALLTTDAALRIVNKSNALPLSPTLLINYDIAVRKEEYVRRMAVVLGGRSRAEGQRITINFLEAGKVGELRQLEVFAEREVKEMPVHVADVFFR